MVGTVCANSTLDSYQEDTMFHILVVEDDRALRELYCTVLSKNGFVYHEARDGADA